MTTAKRLLLTTLVAGLLPVWSQTTAPAFSPVTLPGGQVAVFYTSTAIGSALIGGAGPFTFDLSAGSLPPGIFLNSVTASLGGTPEFPGTYNFTVRVTDRLFRTATVTTALVVTNPVNLPVISTSSFPIGVVGSPYPATNITATGGTGTGYTFTMSGDPSPPGLVLSSAGVLSGTPLSPGDYPVSIEVRDSSGVLGYRNYMISVTEFYCPLGYTILGSPYSASVFTSPFNATSFAITSGVLPPGLSLNTTNGLVTGTTTSPGTFTFIVRATNSMAQQVSRSCSITPQTEMQLTSSRTTARVGSQYRSFVGAIGGVSAYSHSILTGSLPPGLTLDASTGFISGTPTTAGTNTARIRTQDSIGTANDLDLTIYVLARDFQPILRCPLPPVVPGRFYSSGLSLNSAANPVYSITGSLPPGLSLNTLTGQISGSPTGIGLYSFTASASIPGVGTVTASCSISIPESSIPDLNLACPDQSDIMVGEAYASPAIASGGRRPYQFSLSESSLPAGLSLNPNTGLVSGLLTAAIPNFTYVLRAVDATESFTVLSPPCATTVINSSPLTILTSALPNGSVGANYSADIQIGGGSSPFTASILTSLPPGLSFSVVGSQVRITGNPSQAGTTSFRLTVRDSVLQQAFRNYTINVAAPSEPLQLLTTVLNGATVGVNYSSGLDATGGAPPYRFSIVSGALPPGIALSAAGILLGQPTTAGTYRFDLEVIDSLGNREGRSLSLPVFQGNFRLGCPNLQTELGVPYSYPANVIGGSQPYSFYLASGQLPPGLILDSATGNISGRATAAGAFVFVFGVRDARQAQTQSLCSIGVLGGALRIISEGPISTKAAEPYQGQMDAAGGQPPYQWTLLNAAPEAGLVLAANGSFTGRATRKGIFAVTVQARDAIGATATKVLSVQSDDSTLTLSCPAITSFQLGVGATGQFVMTGGQAPYRLSLFSGSLPQGFVLNSSGSFAVTALQAGSFPAQFQAVDETNTAANVRCNFEITGEPFTITTDALPAGQVGNAYSAGISSRGGVGAVRYSLTSGGLPTGLDFDSSTGSITGSPEQEGTFAVGLSATDEVQRRASKTLSVSIEPGSLPFRITTASPLSDALVGRSYSQGFAAEGGKAPYAFSFAGVPAGLSTVGEGVSGTPSEAGQFTITVSARDASGATASKAFLLRVKADGLFILTDSLPDGVEGEPYGIGVIREGGHGPFSWSIVSGAIPPGVEFNPATGNFEGSPSRSGQYSMSVVVTDATGTTARRTYSFEVRPAGVDRLSITTDSLPNGNAGLPYSANIGATGGRSPYGWVISGDLPAGLSFSPDGAISGTPQVIGTSNFQITATDSLGLRASRVFSLTIGTATTPALSIESLPDATTANQTLPLTLRMASAFGVPISGRLTLNFLPDPSHGADDPSIRFASASRTLDFTIPAGSTAVTVTGSGSIATGTLAGTIRIDSVLNFAGASVPGPSRSIVIRRAAPTITSLTLTRSGSGLEVRIEGATNTRQLSEARVTFTAAGDVDLTTASQLTVNVSAAIQSWFASAASQPFGGRFALSLPFTVSGQASSITGVSVVITNGEGASAAATAN